MPVMFALRRLCVAGLKLALVVGLGGAVGQARVGETPDQVSARMLQPGLGRNFSWPKEMAPRELERVKREYPLTPFAHLLPTAGEEWREQMFWKSAVRNQLSGGDGWRVHVGYLKGRSVIELYKREGARLNEFEVNGILTLNRAGGTWRRVEGKKDAKEAADTVIGYEFELGEGEASTLRARRQGDWLIVFHRRFDDYLLERKARWDATEEQRKAEERLQNEKTAPVSVDGF